MQKNRLKGQKFFLPSEMVEFAGQRIALDDAPFYFGQVPFPSSAKYNGFFIQGQMKSGKSATISFLMEEAFRNIDDAGAPVRGVVYDPKNKAPNILAGLGVPWERMRIMNPMDKRCYGWDIQKDVTNQLVARGLARVFIRERGDSDRFWTEAPRGLMSGVMISFILSKLEREKENQARQDRGEKTLSAFEWSLLDVANALSDLDYLREVLGKHADTKPAIRFLEKDKDSGDVIASLEADFAPLRFFASRWKDCPQVSFNDWKTGVDEQESKKKEGRILIFGSEREAPEVDDLNRMMIQRITQIVTRELKQPVEGVEQKKSDIWFFFDEFSKLGKIPDFNDFSTLVREYGGCVVISVQNIEQLRAADCYGEHLANVIVDDLGTKIFLSCEGKAAQFASDTMGDFEEFAEGDSEQFSPQGVSSGISRQKRLSKVVLPAELYQLPPLDEAGVLTGYCMSAALERVVWRFELYGNTDLKAIWKKSSSVSPYEREEDPEAFRFKAWTPEDLEKLGIKTKTEVAPATAENVLPPQPPQPELDYMARIMQKRRAGEYVSKEEADAFLRATGFVPSDE